MPTGCWHKLLAQYNAAERSHEACRRFQVAKEFTVTANAVQK